jgi:hypothetical protein
LSCSLQEGLGVEYLLPYSKGFLAGTSNGIVFIFDKKNDMDPKNPFIRQDKKFQNLDLRSPIVSMMLTSGEENLIVGMSKGQLLSISFGQGDDSPKMEPLV